MGVVAFIEHAVKKPVSGCRMCGQCVLRDTRADQEDAAYALALEQAEHALSLPGVRGLHLTDFRHDGAVSRLCRDLGIPTKEERRAHAHRAQLPV